MFFSCTCNQPERLGDAVGVVEEGMRMEGVTRWGLAYVQGGQVLLSRHPRAVEGEFNFVRSLGEMKSDYVVGCAASDERYRGNANTQPFRFRQWMFALESEIGNFADALPRLEEQMPSHLRRNIRGKTLSEWVFHTFLGQLRSAELDDHNLALARSSEALAAAVRLVEKELQDCGIEEGLGNLVVSNSRSMLVMRRQETLSIRRFRELSDPKRPDTEFRSVLCVSGEFALGEGFEELPEESLLQISRDLTTNIVPLTNL